MWIDTALSGLSGKTTYCRDELYQLFSVEKPDLTKSTFRWMLYNLVKDRKLSKLGYDTYSTCTQPSLPLYTPRYSTKAKALTKKLAQRFLTANFVVFESVLLNEFLNQQIAQNTLYVQAEKDISAYMFDIIREEYSSNVLYNPSKDELYRYWTSDSIIVLDLVSQAPLTHTKPHEMTIEKMLVDIIAEKSIASSFSPSELPCMYENILSTYQVNMRKVYRYAGRRGKTTMVQKYAGGAS